MMKQWRLIPLVFRLFIVVAPVLALALLFSRDNGNIYFSLINSEISLPLKIWGSTGQLIFILRFYIQWMDTESKIESVLTRRFWLISLTGSLMILIYAVLRYDPVLLLGQFSGIVIYIRNLLLERAEKRDGKFGKIG